MGDGGRGAHRSRERSSAPQGRGQAARAGRAARPHTEAQAGQRARSSMCTSTTHAAEGGQPTSAAGRGQAARKRARRSGGNRTARTHTGAARQRARNVGTGRRTRGQRDACASDTKHNARAQAHTRARAPRAARRGRARRGRTRRGRRPPTQQAPPHARPGGGATSRLKQQSDHASTLPSDGSAAAPVVSRSPRGDHQRARTAAANGAPSPSAGDATAAG